ETIKTDQSTTELWNTLTLLEFQNQKTADSFLAAYNGSAQARAEFDKQGITLAKINDLYIQLQANAIIKADNKSYWDNMNANWREGKKEIDEVEKAIKRVFELGKKGDDGPLKQFADDVQAANLAFTQAGDVFDVTAERYLSSIEGAIERLTGISLKKLNQQNADMAVGQVGVDVTTGQVTDPYAQQTAQMEAFYHKQLDLIDQVTDKTKAAMKAEADLHGDKTAAYAALQKQLLGLTTKRTLTEKQQTVDAAKIETESFKSRLSMAGYYTDMAGQLFTELANTQDQSSRQGFETAKAFNLAAAIMSTAAGIMSAFAAPDNVTMVQKVVAAAMVGVTGAIQIANIASTSFGGGASAPSVPAGSFAAGGVAAGSGTGIGNLAVPMTSIRDDQTLESFARLTESTDNASMVIGRLSKSIDSLSALFESGGAGMGLATNAPGRFTDLAKVAGGNLTNALGFGDSMRQFFRGNIAGSLQSFNDSIFGGDWGVSGAGISLGINRGLVTAQDYISEHRDGGLFGGNEDRTSFTTNAAAQEYMQALLKPYITDIVRMATTLGTTANTDSFTSAPVNISTAGRSAEEIAKDMEAWMLTVLQGMSLTVTGLNRVSGAYDDAYAMLKRYNDALVTANEALELIGSTTIQGSLKNAQMVDSLQTMMGGLDKFTEAVNTYFTSMFNDEQQAAQQAAQAARQVNNAFAEMQISVPATRSEFIDLVNGLDITTESGAKTFAALMDIAEAFGLVQDHAADLQQSMDDLLSESFAYTTDLLTQAMDAAADNLRTALDVARNATSQLISLRGGNPNSEQGYNDLRAAFVTAVNTGDSSTVLRLATQLDSASRAYNSGGSNYQADRTMIEQALIPLTGMEETTDLSLTALNAHTSYLESIDQAMSTNNTLTNTNNGALASLNALMATFLESQEALAQANQLSYDSRVGTASGALSAIRSAGSVAAMAGVLNQMATGAISNPFGIDSTLVALAQQVAEGARPQSDLTNALNSVISPYFADYIKPGVTTTDTTVSAPSTNWSDQDRAAQAQAFQEALAIWNTKMSQLMEIKNLAYVEMSQADSLVQAYTELVALKWQEYYAGENWTNGIDLNQARAWYNQAVLHQQEATDSWTLAGTDVANQLAIKPVESSTIDWTTIPGFASGTSYVPYDMMANIHQGEIIMDRESSDILRKYGVPSVGRADNHNRELIDEVRALRKELAEQKAYIAKMETHSAASVRVQQAGFQGVIQSSEKQARSLSGIENAAKLEKAA
ncbi:MAG: hypothetical protein HY888_05305, partial [Deltaproteobacteria bacterium]|nr:hypothetical protein [Deltaproteobacteria bacterium]